MDISDRREIERLKDEFVSVVSHELHPNFNSRCPRSDGEWSPTTQPDKSQRMLETVGNTDRLVRLINDIP